MKNSTCRTLGSTRRPSRLPWLVAGGILAGPLLASAATWSEAISASAPKYWYRFEETDPSQPAANSGSSGGAGVYGPELTAGENLGQPSLSSALGKALVFNEPQAGNSTGKYVDLAAGFEDPVAGIPELTNFRPPTVDKTTSVEYWIKTSQIGSSANQTWNSPCLLAHESGGDGDMYWGWMNGSAQFGFSTSDLTEIYANRVTDGKWHHVVLVKEWHVSQSCRSTMYVDGGTPSGGQTLTAVTAAGNPSYQDTDGGIRYLGFTQSGGGGNLQFIGSVDEVAIYDRELTPAEVSDHFLAATTPDGDGDGMPDAFEIANNLDLTRNDAAEDPDGDGLTNLGEYLRKTDPHNPDTDNDGANDKVETNTGVWVSASDRGTDPNNPDTDGDGLSDGAETNTGVLVDLTNTGSNPFKADTDGDSFDDLGEAQLGTNPSDATKVPSAANWREAIAKSAPLYWYQFEETDPSQPAVNSGTAGAVDGAYGAGLLAGENLGKPSATSGLGHALEFTGPNSGNSTTKYVDLGVNQPDPNAGIPELTNFRPPSVDKTTTVEYFIRTTQRGTSGDQTWNSPALLAKESGGDGDMYWGWISQSGDFGFSTSDLVEVFARRDGSFNVTDGNWHHVVLVKEWHVSEPCVSKMYIDGGNLEKGVTIIRTTAVGNASYQDTDGGIRYLGFTQVGGSGNVQFIGGFDELAIYDRGLTESEVRLHYRTTTGDSDGDGMPDSYETSNGLNPQVNDANLDLDNDGSTNLAEFQRKTDPQNPDTDGDGLKDGVETGTGVFVNAGNTGTDPRKADTDGDGLRDGVETNTGVYVSKDNTGTNPFKIDTDGDGHRDGAEVASGTDPTKANSFPSSAWLNAVRNDAPVYFWRFEGDSPTDSVPNEGTKEGFGGSYGPGFLPEDLGKESATPALGRAIEFTGPNAGTLTTKYVDYGDYLVELVNLRPPSEEKATTVEYWIKTSQAGTSGNQTWNSPAIFAAENPGDGDMYWGWFNAQGQFGFSTSDLTEIFADNVNNDQWHHIMMVKTWRLQEACTSTLFIDGGAAVGGQTIETSTGPGNISYQGLGGRISRMGYVVNGGSGNNQYIGLIDEVAIYNKALTETQAAAHFAAASGGEPELRFTAVTRNPDNTVTLSWAGTGTLQQANGVPKQATEWTDVSPQPAGNSLTVPVSSQIRLFRLVR